MHNRPGPGWAEPGPGRAGGVQPNVLHRRREFCGAHRKRNRTCRTRSREHGLKHPSYNLENVSHCFTARNRNLPTVSRNPSKRCPRRSFRDRCFLLGGAPPRLEAAPPDPFFQSIFARWTFEAAGSAEKLDFDSCGGQTRRRSSRRPSRPALPNA